MLEAEDYGEPWAARADTVTAPVRLVDRNGGLFARSTYSDIEPSEIPEDIRRTLVEAIDRKMERAARCATACAGLALPDDVKVGAVREALEALRPFARYFDIQMTLGALSPKTGPLWSTTSKAGEAEITVEDLGRARAALSSLGIGEDGR